MRSKGRRCCKHCRKDACWEHGSTERYRWKKGDCAYTHAHMHACTHAYTHKYTHAHTHTHIHTHTGCGERLKAGVQNRRVLESRARTLVFDLQLLVKLTTMGYLVNSWLDCLRNHRGDWGGMPLRVSLRVSERMDGRGETHPECGQQRLIVLLLSWLE